MNCVFFAFSKLNDSKSKQLKTITTEWSSKEKHFSEKENGFKQAIAILEDKLAQAHQTIKDQNISESEKILEKESQIFSIASKLEAIQAETQAKEEYTSQLEHQVQKLEEQLASLKIENEHQVSGFNELQLKHLNIASQVEVLQVQVDELSRSLKIKSSELEETKEANSREILEYNNRISSMNEILSNKEQLEMELRSKIRVSDKKFEEIKEQGIILTKSKEENDKRFSDVILQLKETQKKLNDSETNVETLREALLQTQDDHKKKIVDCETEIANLKARCEKQENKSVEYEGDIDSLKAQVNSKEALISEAEESKRKIKEEVSSIIEAKEVELKHLQENLLKEVEKNSEFSDLLDAKSTELQTKDKEYKELEKNYDILKGEQEVVAQYVADFEKDLKSNSDLMAVLQEKNADYASRVVSQTLEIAHLVEENGRVCESVNEKEKNIALLKEEKMNATGKLEEVALELQNIKMEKQSLNESIALKDEKMRQLVKANEELEEKRKEAEELAPCLKQELSEALEELGAEKRKCALLEAENEALGSKIKALEEQIVSLSEKTATSKSEGDAGHMDRLLRQINQLEEDLREQRQQVVKEKENAEALQEEFATKVTRLKFVVKALENENANVKRCFRERKALINSVNESVQRNSELVAEIEDLRLRLKQSEVSLKARDAELSNLQMLVSSLAANAEAFTDNNAASFSLSATEISSILENVSSFSQQREREESAEVLQSELELSRNSLLTLR